MSQLKHSRRKAYKIRIDNAVDNLPKSLYRSFKQALSPHKFNLELYVPKNLLDQHKVEGGNYLRNKLVTFNDNYTQEKEILDQMKKESDDFSRQYQLVTQNPTYDDISKNKQYFSDDENNTKNNNLQPQQNQFKRSKYFNEMLEKYKLLGYNEDEITLNENIFNPSLLLDNSNNFERTCELERKEDLNEDKCFLGNFQMYLNNRNGIHTKKELAKKHSTLNTIQGTHINELKLNNKHYKSMSSDLKLPTLMSTEDLLKRNNKMKNEIKLTKKTLDDFINKDIKKKGGERIPKGKTILVDGVFVSSKGMLRSANKGRNNQMEKGKKINKSVDFNVAVIMSGNRNNNKKDEGNKLVELTKLYNKLSKSGYNEGFSNVSNYINRYHQDKFKPINYEQGSNLHGFVKEYKRIVTKGKMPDRLKAINWKRRELGYKPTLYSNDIENIEHDIDKLEYHYVDSLLEQKHPL